MVLMPRVDTVSRTNRFSLGTQKRLRCRLGSKRRLVRRWEWLTALPKVGRRPVTSQKVVMADHPR